MEEALIKRVLPHNTEAEQLVIGCMLMDKEAISAASEIIHSDDFYGRQYGAMFEAITELYNEGKPTDLVAVQEQLKTKDVPPESYSIAAFRELLNMVPTSVNIRYYANLVYEKALLRRLIRINEEIANDCYMEKEDVNTILESTEKRIFGLLETRATSDYVPIRDVVINVVNKIEIASRNHSMVTGLSTGYTDLDRQTSGMQPSDLILIAARPSMGKTAFVLNLAHSMTIKDKKTVAIFSLEMSKEQLVNRLLAMESRVDSQTLRTGNLSDSDWDQVVESSGIIANTKLLLDDTPGITVAELRSKCRKFKLEHGLDCIMIDYLQLMSGSGARKGDSRQQEISDISRSLKALARELNVPVIALSQLSRACESRTDHRPMLSDLRESGAIEQDADIVMFLYRDEYYNKDSPSKGITEVIIAKQRNGPIGTVELVWMGDLCRFGNKEYTSQ